MAGFLIRRLLWAFATVVLTACFAYGLIRLLRPETYGGGESLLVGTWHDVDDKLLHFTFGDPEIKEMWRDGLWADVLTGQTASPRSSLRRRRSRASPKRTTS